MAQASPAQIGFGVVSVILGIATLVAVGEGMANNNMTYVSAGIPLGILTLASVYASAKVPYP